MSLLFITLDSCSSFLGLCSWSLRTMVHLSLVWCKGFLACILFMLILLVCLRSSDTYLNVGIITVLISISLSCASSLRFFLLAVWTFFGEFCYLGFYFTCLKLSLPLEDFYPQIFRLHLGNPVFTLSSCRCFYFYPDLYSRRSINLLNVKW